MFLFGQLFFFLFLESLFLFLRVLLRPPAPGGTVGVTLIFRIVSNISIEFDILTKRVINRVNRI